MQPAILSSVPMPSANSILPTWPDPAAGECDENVLAPRDAGEVTASVLRHQMDAPRTQIEQTPADAVMVRILMAPCSLAVSLGTQWLNLGEMGEGSVHISHARQVVRTHWQGAREGLMLCIPASHWRNLSVSEAPASALPAHDMPADATLLQLTKMLINAAPGESDAAFSRHMVEVIVARLGVLQMRRGAESRNTSKALPRWRLQRVTAYVKEHVSDAISLADMATAAGMSPMHFAAQFRAATGQRPHHYLLQCRIQHAKALLTDASRSLIDIAISVGFRTQAHFTTVFKNFEQTTPMQWRRSRLYQVD